MGGNGDCGPGCTCRDQANEGESGKRFFYREGNKLIVDLDVVREQGGDAFRLSAAILSRFASDTRTVVGHIQDYLREVAAEAQERVRQQREGTPPSDQGSPPAEPTAASTTAEGSS